MQAAGPASHHYDPALQPLMKLLQGLAQRRDLTEVNIDKPGFRLNLRRAS